MGERDVNSVPEEARGTRRTRLWSMISAITAILPVHGPDLRRTTV